MRRLAAVLVLAALAAPVSAGAERPDRGATAQADRWRPDVRAAARWVAARQGEVSFGVRTRAGIVGRGLDHQYPSASVVKAMLMVTYLRSAPVRDRPLGRADRALLRPMIRRSDNLTATAIRNTVGNAALARLARRAGMTSFSVDPVWGRSLITARDQTRFFLRIDRLVPRRHRAYAMRLLQRIAPSQRWGMGEAVPVGWRLYFKGGWGAGTGAVDHQVGLLRRGPHRIAVAVLTVGNPTHRYGKATLEGVFRRLMDGLVELRGTAGRVEAELAPTP